MKTPPTPATVGALARDARLAAGISQSELGKRIGASRFWVAQFERGKPSAELGLALKALQALGLSVRVEPREAARARKRAEKRAVATPGSGALPAVDLGQIIAASTTAVRARSTVDWPAAAAGKRSARGS
jgi:transcriptional regulator with XRE-family HTH domain